MPKWLSVAFTFCAAINLFGLLLGSTYGAWQAAVVIEGNSVTIAESWDIPEVLPASGVVLNEFLPNPDGNKYGHDFGEDGDLMPKGEWIELYNNDEISHDLTDWYIEDLAGDIVYITASNTQPATTTIAAKGWLVVYMNKAFLDNITGDEIGTITLYNSSGVQQDT